ncbi:Protein MAIN-LIKE 1 [Linum perenne]
MCRHSKKIVDYDLRFESILCEIGLYQLKVVLLLTPDPELITTLVERWSRRHFCYPIPTDAAQLCDYVENLLGKKPETVDMNSGRIKMTWLREKSAYCEGAIRDDDIETIHQYCRAYILYFFSSCIFDDRSRAWAPWFKDKTRFILLSVYRQLLDEGTPFIWQPWERYEGRSPQSFTVRHVVTPLICYFSVQWHRPDRVLRQFGMDQPIPTFDMP